MKSSFYFYAKLKWPNSFSSYWVFKFDHVDITFYFDIKFNYIALFFFIEWNCKIFIEKLNLHLIIIPGFNCDQRSQYMYIRD